MMGKLAWNESRTNKQRKCCFVLTQLCPISKVFKNAMVATCNNVPTCMYLFKVNNGHIRAMFEYNTIKTPGWCHWRSLTHYSGVSTFDSEQVNVDWNEMLLGPQEIFINFLRYYWATWKLFWGDCFSKRKPWDIKCKSWKEGCLFLFLI